MKYTLFIAVALLALTACKPNPRYRTAGNAGQQRSSVGQKAGYSTNDMLRLGKIMRSYLGKPYQLGSKYGDAVDCSQLVMEVFKKFDDIRLPRTVADQYTKGKIIQHRQLAYGDLVFFNTVGGRVSHVGIYCGPGEFIHASTSKGVIISKMSERYWSKRYAGARRVLGEDLTQTRP